MKLNLIGDTFTHLSDGNLGYSVHAKRSKYIEWVTDGTGEGTVFMDNVLGQVNEVDLDGLKYGWLLESKHITPEIVNAVKNEWREYTNAFDMIFTHNQELLRLSPKFKWVPAQGFWIKQPALYQKSKNISMIASNKSLCVGHERRLQWVYRLRKKVDLYGRGFKDIPDKEAGLVAYRFSVAIENGQYETYFTEKLLDCFASGTIPVYIGAPDIDDYFNGYGIVHLTEATDFSELTEEYYRDRFQAVQQNLDLAKQYEILEDFIYLNYLKDI